MEAGGRADKLGNRFEETWVAVQLLHVLAGQIRSVEIESVGDDEKGVDLWVERPDGTFDAQQCKRGNRSEGTWPMSELKARGVLKNLRLQLDRSEQHTFTFVSGDRAPLLNELCERAQGAGGDPGSYFSSQIQPFANVRSAHKQFCTALGLSAESAVDRESAYGYLERSRTYVFPAGRNGADLAASVASFSIEDHPDRTLSFLRDLVSDESNWARRLDANWLISKLSSADFRLRNLAGDGIAAARIDALGLEFEESISPELLSDGLIARAPASELIELVEDDAGPRLIAVLGEAGGGKSCALLNLVRSLRAEDTLCLPIRLDRRTPAISAREFGKATCDLPASPGQCLKAVSGSRRAVLVLDQLDAIRWTSSHGLAAWEACKEVIRDALQFENLRVVVACRTFDWETDPMIGPLKREHKCRELRVAPLSDEEIRTRIESRDGDYAALSVHQRQLLRSPFALSLWEKLHSVGAAGQLFANLSDLIKALFDERLKRAVAMGVSADDFLSCIAELIHRMDQQQRLDAAASAADRWPAARDALLSGGILAAAGGRLHFSHQIFFDYQIARRVIEQSAGADASFENWILQTNQELFRREQVRLALSVVRQEAPERFVATVREILDSSSIRFHIQHLAIQCLGYIDSPNDDELELVLELLNDENWRPHVSDNVLTISVTWFDALCARDLLAEWLDSDQPHYVDLGLLLCRVTAEERGDDVARVLRQFDTRPDPWPDRIRDVTSHVNSSASRQMFELQLGFISSGPIKPYMTDWRGLSRGRPDWLLEAVAAYMNRVASEVVLGQVSGGPSHATTSDIEIPALAEVESNGFAEAAKARPREIWTHVVPAIASLASASLNPALSREGEFEIDAIWHEGRDILEREPEECLRASAIGCAVLAETDPSAFQKGVLDLSTSKLFTCQRFAGLGLSHAPISEADFAYKWLSDDLRRLRFGYHTYADSWQTSREILSRFGEHCTEAQFRATESAILESKDPLEWESAKTLSSARRAGKLVREINLIGLAAFIALSSMPKSRLSPRSVDRLGVLERKFGSVEGCLIPGNGKIGFKSRPAALTRETIARMSDSAWKALIKREQKRSEMECSDVQRRQKSIMYEHVSLKDVAVALDSVAKLDPNRFGRIWLGLPFKTDDRLLGSILEGFGQESCPTNEQGEPVVGGWQPASADLIEEVLERTGSIEDTESALRFCRMIQRRPEADWSSNAIALLGWCATKHPSPDPEHLPVTVSGGNSASPTARSISGSAINSVRGEAAGAIAQLVFADQTRLEALGAVTEALVKDPSPAVRCAAIEVCRAVFSVDSARAMSLFLEAITDTEPAVLGTQGALDFLRYATGHGLCGSYSVACRMTVSPDDDAIRYGSYLSLWCVLQGRHFPELFSRCRRLRFLRSSAWLTMLVRARGAIAKAVMAYRSLQARRGRFDHFGSLTVGEMACERWSLFERGVGTVNGDLVQRVAAADVAARSIQNEGIFSVCAEILVRLADDEETKVQIDTGRSMTTAEFWDNEGAAEFLEKYVKTKAFRRSPGILVRSMREHARNLTEYSEVIVSVCNIVAGEISEASDGQDHWFAYDPALAEVLLRLYGEADTSGSREIQDLCLDCWDSLLRARVVRARETLEQIDFA